MVCPKVEQIFLASLQVQNFISNSIKIQNLVAHLKIDLNQWFLKSFFNMTCMVENNKIVFSRHSEKNMVYIEKQCDYTTVPDFRI